MMKTLFRHVFGFGPSRKHLSEKLEEKNAEAEKDWDDIDGFMNNIDKQISESLEKIGEFPGKPAGMADRIDVACNLIASIPFLKSEIDCLRKNNQANHDLKEKFRQKIAILNGSIQKWRAERDGLADEASDAQLSLLNRNKEISSLKKKIGQLEDDRAGLNASLRDMKGLLDARDEEIAKLRLEILDLRLEADKLKDKPTLDELLNLMI